MTKLTANSLDKKITALKVGERIAIKGVPEDMYHDSQGIGSTLMKAASKSMAHYKEVRDAERSFTAAQLDEFAIGSATHCLVLEPELYEEKFAAKPDHIKKRAGPEWLAFQGEHLGKTILKSTDDEALSSRMAEATFDECGQFFVNGEAEKSYWYRHDTGLILKARVDYETGDGVVDLKTTIKDTPESFAKAVKYDYDIQDASYRLATGLPDMIYIGVYKKAPHSVYISKQCSFGRQIADAKVESALHQIIFAEEFDSYPNIPAQLIETEFSEYERNKLLAVG